MVITGGLKYLGWETFPGRWDGWMPVNICQASLWRLQSEQTSLLQYRGYRATDTVASPIGTPDEKTCRAGPSHAVWSAARNAPVQPSDPLKQPGPSLPSFLSPQVIFALQKSQKLPKQQMPSPLKEHQHISPSTVKC